MIVELDFREILAQWPLLLRGVLWTIVLATIGTMFGLLLGVAGAWSRAWGPAPLRVASGVYVELVRNTPFIVQLFFLFFGLPSAGIRISPEVASMLAMVINLGAYSTEIIRAGIEATPKGQIEAGISLALNRYQIFTRVVLPPALRKVWPSIIGQSVIVMLGSAVCGQISTPELSYAANLISSQSFRSFEAFVVATAIYLLLAVLMRHVLAWIGRHFLFGR